MCLFQLACLNRPAHHRARCPQNSLNDPHSTLNSLEHHRHATTLLTDRSLVPYVTVSQPDTSLESLNCQQRLAKAFERGKASARGPCGGEVPSKPHARDRF